MIKVLQMGMGTASRRGGIEEYLINQYRYSLCHGIQYDFIYLQSGPMAFEDEIKKQSNIFYLPERRKYPFRYYINLIRLFRHLSKENYQGIVMNMGGLSHASPLLLAKWYGIPVRIAHSHTGGTETPLGWGRRFMYYFNRKITLYSATELWACSKRAGQYLFHVDNVKVIRNGIDVDHYVYDSGLRDSKRKELGLSGKFVIGHVGRFSPVKNHFFLLTLFRSFHIQHPESVLLFVGDDSNLDAYGGYVRKVKEYIHEHGLESSVIFTGYISDVSSYYQVFDIFLFPSISEGLGLVSIEAQTSNLPCIVSSCVPEEVIITQNIRRISLDDQEEWLDAMNCFFAERVERKSNKDLLFEKGCDASVTMQMIAKYWKEMVKYV